MCQLANCDCKKFKGLGATGVQTGISSGGAAAGAIAGTLIGGPVGSLVGAGIGIAASAISSLFTPDYTKIYASNDANEIATQMGEMLVGWQALPQSSKVPATQEYFVNLYGVLWQNLVSACSSPSLGTAGQNCISDRSPGGKYPWATYYLAPIQNDTIVAQTGVVSFNDPLTGIRITVQPDSASGIANQTLSAASGIANELGVSPLELLIGAGVLALFLL